MSDLSTGEGSGEQRCGEYQLVDRLSQPGSRVEHWHARGPWGPAEVYRGDSSLLTVARGMPGWGPFPVVEWGETAGQSWVAVPGRLVEDLTALGRRLEPGATLAFGWHAIAAVAELHENGSSHGALSASQAGLDELGRLTIRPALAGAASPDPNPTATAQASDCLALGRMLDALRVDLIDDDAVRLLMRGLRREKARLRLHPGRSVRQAMAAVLARHPEHEKLLVAALGSSWKLSRLPSAPPPVRPRLTAEAPWARHRHDDETPISSPAQVFLGQGKSGGRPSETSDPHLDVPAQQALAHLDPSDPKAADLDPRALHAAEMAADDQDVSESAASESAASELAASESAASESAESELPASESLASAPAAADLDSAEEDPADPDTHGHELLEALDAGPDAGNDDIDSDLRATAQAAAVLGVGEGTDDPGTYETQAPPSSQQREEDTALQPVPDSAAAEIVEAEALRPEDDDGTYLSAGSSPVSVDEMPRRLDHSGESGEDPDTDVMAEEHMGEDLGDDGEILSVAEPVDDFTADTSLPQDMAELSEDPSSVLAGLAEVHHGRDEIPLGALELSSPEDVEDEESAEWDDESVAGEVIATNAELEAAAEAERAAQEQAAQEQAELEARAAELTAAEAARVAAARLEAARLEAAEQARREIQEAARKQAARAEAEQVARREAEEAARLRAEEVTAQAVQREEEMLQRAAGLDREALAEKLAEEARARAAAQPLDRLAEAGLGSLDKESVHLDDRAADRLGADGPRWAGAGGVTGDSSREKELGKGKWLEEARSLDEVAAELPSGLARDMDMEQSDGSGPVLWVVLGVAAVLALLFLGWRVAGSNATPTETVAEAPKQAETTAVAEALPEAPSVTVVSEPSGARVTLDGKALGVAPVLVPVPTDSAEHELCLELAEARACRQLTGQALASSDPYVFPLD